MLINESSQFRQTIPLQRSPATQEEAFQPDQELFGPNVIDRASLGEYSGGTHVVATLYGSAKDNPIKLSAAAAETLAGVGKDDPEQLTRALEYVQTHGASITSNSWGSNTSSSYMEAWAALQSGQPAQSAQTDGGYLIRP